MNSYFHFIEKYNQLYPKILLESYFFKDHECLFILDPSLPINLIKESELIPFLGINRIIKYSLRDSTVNTIGEAKVCINYTVLEFQTINSESNSNIVGILGLPFSFDIINEIF